MSVPTRVQKWIWGLFAARCAICRQKLVWKSEAGSRSLTGEIAHVVGDKTTAARGNYPLDGDRDDPDNLLLLCREHHKVIDDNADEYPVERLHEIRSNYLTWLDSQLTPAQPWAAGIISQYTYLNVPRLNELTAMLGYQIRHQPVTGSTHLSQLNFELNDLMHQYHQTLDGLPLQSIPVGDIEFAHEGYAGQLISFERFRFRNKNVPLYRPDGTSTKFTGDPARDPHIYHSFPDWKLMINIDLQWITTSTAYGLVRSSGAGTLFSGFARIIAVDLETQTMLATGLAIGVPPSLLDFGSALQVRVDMESFEDDVSKARGGKWCDEVPSCDGCGKNFKVGDYMVDGPLKRGGPWGNICQDCFAKGDRRLGTGYGQLYRKINNEWLLVGGSSDPEIDEELY